MILHHIHYTLVKQKNLELVQFEWNLEVLDIVRKGQEDAMAVEKVVD
jgi:hypothetical protein